MTLVMGYSKDELNALTVGFSATAQRKAAEERRKRFGIVVPKRTYQEPQELKEAVAAHFVISEFYITQALSIETMQLSLTKRELTVETIKAAVCKVFDVDPSELISGYKKGRGVIPRQVVCYVAAKYTAISMAEIGQHLGGRDYSTVVYSWKHIAELLPNNKYLRCMVALVLAELGLIPKIESVE